MGWLRVMTSARWFPYVLIGAASIALIVFGWGYMKGYDSAEDQYLKEMNRAMKAQYDQLMKVHQKDMAAAVREAARSGNVRQRIRDVHRPAGCSWPPECVQSFNDGVLATDTGAAGVDG